jgi:uncharacterized protein YutE (UPF0331/DUF86 family)
VAQAALDHADIEPLLARCRIRLIHRLAHGQERTKRDCDATIILRRLITLRDYVARARMRSPASVDALRDDLLLQDALAMSLFVAIQEAADICFHIVADEGWGLPSSYAEGFELLERNGLIERETARALSGMAALRNRLAHGYASADHARLWSELPTSMDALERFVGAVATFIERTSDDNTALLNSDH